MIYMKLGQLLPDGKFIPDDAVFRIADNAIIPFAEGNVDYAKYLEWIEEGNEPIEFDIQLLQN
jgi:hypothetical protein